MDAGIWRQVLAEWKSRIANFQNAQHEQANRLDKRHYRLGVPATVFSAVAGTTVFATLGKDFSIEARLIVAFVSIATAILTAMQTFQNYGKRAEACRSTSHQFGILRREIDILEQFPPTSEKEMQTALQALNSRIGEITKDAPLIELQLPSRGSRASGTTVSLPSGRSPKL